MIRHDPGSLLALILSGNSILNKIGYMSIKYNAIDFLFTFKECGETATVEFLLNFKTF